jgi:hypothetical protein
VTRYPCVNQICREVTIRNIRIDGKEAEAVVSGQLAERFEQACAYALVAPDAILERMVRRFTEGEEARLDAIEGISDFWDYALPRRDQLEEVMHAEIDWDSLPPGGPDGVFAVQCALELKIERIVEKEWKEIEEGRSLRA